MSVPTRTAPPPPPMRKGQVQAYEAIFTYQAQKRDELSFEEGDLLFIVDQTNDDWWLARLENKEGLIPSNYVSNDNARVPIIAAARRGNLALVQECLGNGVSVNALDKSGSSALHAAAQAGHVTIVQCLLNQPKIEVNLQNKIGDTPLHCASYRGHNEIVDLLLLNGASTSVKNRDNCTARNLSKRSSVIGQFDAIAFRDNCRPSTFDAKEYLDPEGSDNDSD